MHHDPMAQTARRAGPCPAEVCDPCDEGLRPTNVPQHLLEREIAVDARLSRQTQ